MDLFQPPARGPVINPDRRDRDHGGLEARPIS